MTVTVCDVAARDGLQNDPTILAPEIRAELVDRLAAAGLPRIEAVSFVNPARVPQMAGAEEVVSAIDQRDGVVYAGLVLNEKGYDRLARDRRSARCTSAFASTETFNQRNQNASVAGVARRPRQAIVERAHADGIRATVTIGASFGCPFEGRGRSRAGARNRRRARRGGRGRDRLRRHDRSRRPANGARRSSVGAAAAATRPIGVHLHNTRNTGIANALAAVEAGATVIDASVGGIGGCPFAPRATGNICTEDLVYMLHGEGVETGNRPRRADRGRRRGSKGVLGRQLEGMVYRAGTFAAVAG